MISRNGPSEALDPVSRLIFELSKLPGIGEKTATRLAYYILKQDASFSATSRRHSSAPNNASSFAKFAATSPK